MSVTATEGLGSSAAAYAAQAAAAAAGTAETGGATTTTSKSNDKDMFLQLLVAQMKYQDPMNPTDSGEFLAQSAQFTALEKMQTVADEVAALGASQMAFGASGLMGKQVSWTAQDGTVSSGLVSQVHFRATGPVLQVDGAEVSLGSVSSITAPDPD